MTRTTLLSRTPLLALSAFFLLLSAASGQTFRREAIQDLRVEFLVHKALTTIPIRLGSSGPMRGKFDTQNSSDFIYGKIGPYAWHLYVYEFDLVGGEGPTTKSGGKKEGDGEGEEAEEEETAEEMRKRLASGLRRKKAKNFAEWVKGQDPSSADRNFIVEGKKQGRKLKYEYWEYTDVNKIITSNGAVDQLWYHQAAVYQVGAKEVAFVCLLPVRKGRKPDAKWFKVGKKMLTSVSVTEVAENDNEIDEDRDLWAKTPEQKKALEAAKANVIDLPKWDYFTSESYIILYSWETRNKRKDAWKFAKTVARKMEEIRGLFMDYYPPHEKQELHYSVIRVCSNYDEFSSYGNTPRGVVGWFSPGSKELVIFYDSDRIFGKPEDAIQVSFHEAWHQYSDGYFPDVELHRWFDEGLAEFFSAHVKAGSRWRYQYHKGRFDSIRSQIQQNTYIPIDEIIYWSRGQFYGRRAPDHYAQGYAFVDFLQRGDRKGRWNEDWAKIIETYGNICLEEKDPKKAVDVAFEGVDFSELSDAWIAWTQKYLKTVK